MRTVNFENKEWYLKLTGGKFVKLQKELTKQLLNFKDNQKKAQKAKEKITDLLKLFNEEKKERKRNKIALKIKECESEMNKFNIFVNSFNTLYLYLLSFYMLEDIDGNKPYKTKEDFIRMADLEEIKLIEDDIESLFRGVRKEDYVKQKEIAQKKIVKDRKKKLKAIQKKIYSKI